MARYIYEWKPTEQGKRLFRRPGTGPAPRRVKPAPEPAPAEPTAPSYDSLKKPELVALAEERSVDASGTKAEIVERLTADDAARLVTTDPSDG